MTELKPTILISECISEVRTELINILNPSFNILLADTEEDIFGQINLNPELSTIIINPLQENLNGFDLVKKFKSFPQLKHISFIFVISKDDDVSQIKGLELGVIDFITLPLKEKIIPPFVNSIIKKHNEVRNEEQAKILNIQAQEQKKINSIINIDKITGIYNELTFAEKTSELLKANPDKKYVIIRWDIDRFKVYNQTFGYKEGDKLLAQIGKIYQETVPSTITYGHITADHFVSCSEFKYYDQESTLNRITTFLSKLNPNFEFIVRLGLYIIESPYEDISLCCDKALLAQKSIKNSFQQRFAYYSESMLKALLKEQELISEMEPALAKRQFILYLQPQYDYTTNTMTGAEVLVRWKHPEKGLIPPGLFIPIFENNGFISKLDLYIWEEACRLLRKWIDLGLNPVPISVNISRRDIYSQNLVDIFENLIKTYKLDPRMLRLEITESAYMENPEQLIKVVDDLRDLGFCIEMDDFGSGYSSLNTLKDVPVDVLKLDMKFIMSATQGTDSEKSKGGHILSSIVRMANWLKLPVIAEGIETGIQADYLKSIGCFYMQGYYFAKPLPVDEYEKLLFELPLFTTKPKVNTEVVEVSKLLDASTHTTLMFNSFVGGAAIIEWAGDKVEALRVNDKFYEEIETTREKFIYSQLNLMDALVNASKTTFAYTLMEAQKTEKEAFCEIELKPKKAGGETIWLKARVRYLSKTITSSIFYLAIDNISFRMNLLQLNAKLSDQLTTIMESVPAGILSFEYKDGMNFSHCNAQAATMFGYSLDEFTKFLRKDLFSFIHKDDQEEFSNLMHKIEDEEIPSFDYTFRHMCKDGSSKLIQGKGHLIARSNGTKYMNVVITEVPPEEENTKTLVRK